MRQPVYLEEWSTCDGPGRNGVRSLPGVTVAGVEPSVPDGPRRDTTEYVVRQLVDQLEVAASGRGLSYAVRAVDGTVLVAPDHQASFLETVVTVTPEAAPTLEEAHIAILDAIGTQRGIFLARPPPFEEVVPNTVTVADLPAWQAMRRLYEPLAGGPRGWLLRVYPNVGPKETLWGSSILTP